MLIASPLTKFRAPAGRAVLPQGGCTAARGSVALWAACSAQSTAKSHLDMSLWWQR